MITIKQIQELEKEEIIKNNNIELTELENEKYLIQIECKKGYVNSNILKAERIVDCFKNSGISNVIVHLFDEQHPRLTILKIKGEKSMENKNIKLNVYDVVIITDKLGNIWQESIETIENMKDKVVYTTGKFYIEDVENNRIITAKNNLEFDNLHIIEVYRLTNGSNTTIESFSETQKGEETMKTNINDININNINNNELNAQQPVCIGGRNYTEEEYEKEQEEIRKNIIEHFKKSEMSSLSMLADIQYLVLNEMDDLRNKWLWKLYFNKIREELQSFHGTEQAR